MLNVDAQGNVSMRGSSNLEQVLTPRLSFSNAKWNINFAGHLHRLRRKTANRPDIH